jgi:thiopurine S-methyltransferase
MRPEFWLDRWSEGRIGFHKAHVEPRLKQHWADLDLPKGCPVFVPLCGKSVDLAWLVDEGHQVTGVELSDIAAQAFFIENGIPARRRICPEFDRYEAQHLALLRGDFFQLTPAVLGYVPAVYDRAALISWSPELRDAYVEHLNSFVAENTSILLITVEYTPPEPMGPPFSIDFNEVCRLFAADYSVQVLGRDDVLNGEPRMRARGVTTMHEVCYRLVRNAGTVHER